MKRYSMNAIGETRPNALGLWAEYTEVHALLRAVAEEVKFSADSMECEEWGSAEDVENVHRSLLRALALLAVK